MIDDEVSGSVIHFMWDGAPGVLWDATGQLPDDPAWLRSTLGLSHQLVADLAAWAAGMSEARPRQATRLYLRRRAETIAERLADELATRFEVVFHPWT